MKNTDSHISENASADITKRSHVLERYISEPQPFHIRWGMFVIAIFLILVTLASFFIKIPVTKQVTGKLSGKQGKLLSITNADGTACRLNEGEAIRMDMPDSAGSNLYTLNATIVKAECSADRLQTILLIAPYSSTIPTNEIEKAIFANRLVHLRFKSGSKTLFSFLYSF